ncbi:cytochrome c oxidase subunit 3 family protein [Thermithiobacillus plumbiphilus]|uniref:Cytochrome c oxidase subunit 3 family protein n=1 Tax=Thermithiobacillus plumbiphilus TaxID=1729899 RepID=A0ABU9D8H6_9PROT
MQSEAVVLSSRPADDLPGDFAIWVFIFAELLAFGIFFLAYAFARSQDVALFNASQLTINKVSGAVNTLVLITSSYFAVRAVAAIRMGRNLSCSNWLFGAIGLGAVFVAIKLMEFHAKFSAGISLSTNTFYMFYLSLTLFHFMHVLMGMVILAVVAFKARRGGYSATQHTGVETGASYWHMVDLVWVILFALVYVIR